MTIHVNRTQISTERWVSLYLDSDADDDLFTGRARRNHFRPGALKMRWVRRTDEDTWRLAAVDLSGPIVKKDGTLSVQNGALGFVDWETSHLLPDAPSWVAAFVERYSPGGHS